MIKQFISELEVALGMIEGIMRLDPELDREALELAVLRELCEERVVLLSEAIDYGSMVWSNKQ